MLPFIDRLPLALDVEIVLDGTGRELDHDADVVGHLQRLRGARRGSFEPSNLIAFASPVNTGPPLEHGIDDSSMPELSSGTCYRTGQGATRPCTDQLKPEARNSFAGSGAGQTT